MGAGAQESPPDRVAAAAQADGAEPRSADVDVARGAETIALAPAPDELDRALTVVISAEPDGENPETEEHDNRLARTVVVPSGLQSGATGTC